jgi:hypothetical protein
MPKSKPTQVIVHRIELQEKEREMMETYVAGKTVKNLVEPAVAVAGAYVAYKSAYSLYKWGDDWYTGIKERMAKQKAGDYPDKEDGGYTNIFGLPGWGIWPGVW